MLARSGRAASRAARRPEPIDVEGDPFAPGHEGRTPPELYALRPGSPGPDTPGWQVRVVPNLYPALTPAEPDDDLGHSPSRDARSELFAPCLPAALTR